MSIHHIIYTKHTSVKKKSPRILGLGKKTPKIAVPVCNWMLLFLVYFSDLLYLNKIYYISIVIYLIYNKLLFFYWYINFHYSIFSSMTSLIIKFKVKFTFIKNIFAIFKPFLKYIFPSLFYCLWKILII